MSLSSWMIYAASVLIKSEQRLIDYCKFYLDSNNVKQM